MYFKIIIFTLIICIINQIKITENAPLNEESSTLENFYNKNLEYLEIEANPEFLKSTTLPSDEAKFKKRSKRMLAPTVALPPPSEKSSENGNGFLFFLV
uniref:Uncharacterized protein n=1 Tax=Meloidogyne enterolobii TaxID=390850 RepID=A0A6V7UNX2_MELEN|nr:unnamed protein product [Meloidogyne enterolobii]